MSTPGKTVYIVSHTHWDREWYRPWSSFRVDLATAVRGLLETLERDPAFRHFVLDGQAILLEDYLEIHPEDGERIRRLAEQGRLSLGPWYVLPDEFLVSGEATLRNLLLGRRVCERFGGPSEVGYLPDSFGHLAQLPQMLRGSGINSFIYTRGSGDELEELGSEYLWEAPDGSAVLAICQEGGYCNAGGLGFREIWEAHTPREVDPELAVERVRVLLEELERRSNSCVLLLNNGCDHFPPQRDLGPILARLRETFPDCEFIHESHARYVAAVRRSGVRLKTWRGELLGGRYHHILSGVWSARMYLKQDNHRAQKLLERYLEPLAAWLRFLHGGEYPEGLIRRCWKRLLENHPHDSICGCSVDEVHEEMETRFAEVIQSCEQALHRILCRALPLFARREKGDRETVLAVFNPLAFPRSEPVRRLVILLPGEAPVEEMELVDEAGRELPFEVLERHYLERFWNVDYRAELFCGPQLEKLRTYIEHFGRRMRREPGAREDADQFVLLQFIAEDVPGLGHRSYSLKERKGKRGEPADLEGAAAETVTGAGGEERAISGGSGIGKAAIREVRLRDNLLDNGILRVRLHADGRFDLEDLRDGSRYPGFNLLVDGEDAGDEYDYSPCPESGSITSSGIAGELRIVEAGRLSACLESRFDLRLPESLSPDRRRRHDVSVACPITVQVRLRTGSPLVEVRITMDNRARDHRLRAHFPTGIRSGRIHSDGQFLVADRPVEREPGEDWVQPPADTVPQQDFSLVQDSRRGLALLNRGLPEIAALRGEDGTVTMALTLLRAVGWLSRDDFPTRRFSNAGPTLHTPGAQCPGPRIFEFALLPFQGDWLSAGVKRVSECYQAPLILRQGVADGRLAGGTPGLLEHRAAELCVSAIKRHEERDTLLVRLYNTADAGAEDTLVFGRELEGAWRSDLLERRVAALPLEGGNRLRVTLGPHRILSLELQFAER